MYSFSQNFEDVYIHRAFSNITDGFYIDAGAFDPVVDSVTKMLYDLGWSGINLEPGPSFPNFSCRTRDINLPLALTGKEGKIVFYYNAADPGTSTTADCNKPPVSPTIQSYEVVSTTLTAVVQAHAPDRHIHFLKLDIEGSEWDVLQSTNWREIRPELIIAESSKPYTNVRRDEGWTDHMKSFDYEEVFFDGINTYYLRHESLFRRDAFRFPVNVLDGVRKFEPYQHHVLNDPESLALIKNISQEVARVVEAENTTMRDYLDINLHRKLRDQQDEYYSQLCAIADNLPLHFLTSYSALGGNDTEAVIQKISNCIADLSDERQQSIADLALAQEAAERHETALREQEKRTDQAMGTARVLAKRLGDARASRITILQLTERLSAARMDSNAASEAGRLAAAHLKELDHDFAIIDQANPLAERIANARAVPAWRRLLPLGTRSLVRRADSYRDNGDWLEAAQAYARAYAIRPQRVDLCLQMANMLTQLEAFSLAELAYREALAKSPSDGLILLHLGHMFEQSNRPLRACLAYRKSSKLIPDHPHIDVALSRVERSIGISPTN